MDQIPELWTANEMRDFAHRAGSALGIYLAFWIGARIVSLLVRRVTRHADENSDLVELLGRIAGLALNVFGIVTALGTAGINVSALVAGLGLTGFALGFAFRDVLSNLLAGVLILLYRPFSRGELISVTGLEGKVVHIDLRYTTLENAGRIILIPNSSLFTNPIIVMRTTEPQIPPGQTGIAGNQ